MNVSEVTMWHMQYGIGHAVIDLAPARLGTSTTSWACGGECVVQAGECTATTPKRICRACRNFIESRVADEWFKLASPKPHVRWMIRRDMEAVFAIDSDGFADSWTEAEYLHALKQRNCIGMVAEHVDRVVGSMVYELHKSKLQILRIAVALSDRRLGIGRTLIEKLKGKLHSHRRTRIVIRVPERLLGAQLFLKAQGFEAVRVDGEEYVMQFAIPASVETCV